MRESALENTGALSQTGRWHFGKVVAMRRSENAAPQYRTVDVRGFRCISGLPRCEPQDRYAGRAPRVRSGKRALPSASSRHEAPLSPVMNRRSPAPGAFDSIGRLTDDLVAEAKPGGD